MASKRSFGLKGFETTLNIPFAKQSSKAGELSEAVIMIILASSSMSLKAANVSHPFMPGIDRSSVTISGINFGLLRIHICGLVNMQAGQDVEAKAQTARDHAVRKPSSKTLNKAKVKVKDALD